MHSTVFPSTHAYRFIHTSVTTYKDSCGGRVKRLRRSDDDLALSRLFPLARQLLIGCFHLP